MNTIGTEYLSGEQLDKARDVWSRAGKSSVAFAKELSACGVTKQLVNRIPSTFAWVNRVVPPHHKILLTFIFIFYVMERRNVPVMERRNIAKMA